MKIRTALAHFVLAITVIACCTVLTLAQTSSSPSPTPQTLGDKVLWRLTKGNDYFYTSDCNGRNEAVQKYGYRFEGIQAYLSSEQTDYTNPLYQLHHKQNNNHFYTQSEYEAKQAEQNNGYQIDGIVGYIAKEQLPSTTPFYRAYDENKVAFFYTTTKSELDNNPSWKIQGVIGYLWLKPTNDLTKFISSCAFPSPPPPVVDTPKKGDVSCSTSQCRCYCPKRKEFYCAEKFGRTCVEACDFDKTCRP